MHKNCKIVAITFVFIVGPSNKNCPRRSRTGRKTRKTNQVKYFSWKLAKNIDNTDLQIMGLYLLLETERSFPG